MWEWEEVDGGWTVLNTCLSLRTGLMIGFGLSPGTLVEIAYSKYHKKYLVVFQEFGMQNYANSHLPIT